MAPPRVVEWADETVTSLELQRAENLIMGVLRRYRETRDARVRLAGAARMTMVAQVNLVHDRMPVRAQSDGTGGFALRFVADRLDRQLERITNETPRWQADPGRRPLASVTGERPIVRRKVVTPEVCDVSEAVATMAALDFDSHLFCADTACRSCSSPIGPTVAAGCCTAAMTAI